MVCKWPYSDHMPLLPAENVLWLHWLQRGKKCILHSVREIILLLAQKLTSILRVTVEDIQASTKANFPRNKYMRMWSWCSLQMRAIRPRFPTMVMRYITKKNKNKEICHRGWYLSPVRKNSVSNVAFLISVSLIDGLEKQCSKCEKNIYQKIKKNLVMLVQIKP